MFFVGLPAGHHALGPHLVRALVPSSTCTPSPVVLTSQELSHTGHSTVSPHTFLQQVSPQLPPGSSGAAPQQQHRAGPLVQIPVTAPVAQKHSPQNASVLPVQVQQQQHSPVVSTGTPVTVFQQVPQGHILTARVQGVCPPIAQNPPLPQSPPLCGPQMQPQCVAVPSPPPSSIQGGGQALGVGTVSNSLVPRVTFQNIAPKPAPTQSGVPAAAIAPHHQQQPQQPQAQSVVIVNPSPQQSPAYPPAIHQIVLANPSTISGAQTIQLAGQPGAASTSCPPHPSNQGNAAAGPTLSIKRHQQQQQLPLLSQTPPPQPTSTESSLIKQLLLPKRGPSTPGGKLILPAPQMPLPNSTIAPSPQVIYQASYNTQNASPQPQQLNVQLLPGQLPAVGAPGVQTVQLLPGQLISTSSAGATAIIQGPAAAGQVTFAVVPNAGFTSSTAAVAAVSQGTVTQGVPPPPYSTGTMPQHTPAAPPPPLPAPLRGDKIICQKEEEAKDATGLHVHERTIEVMENSSLGEGNAPKAKTSNGDVGTCAKLLNGQKCVESNLPPYHSGNSQVALNGPAPEAQPANGKQAPPPHLNAPLEDAGDSKKTLVNGVCDFDKSDNGGPCNRNIPNHIASKQYLGNGELGSSEKSHGSEPALPSPPPQTDTAKAQQTERLANGPPAGGNRPPSELMNGPLVPGHVAPVLRQQLLPNSTFPPTVPVPVPVASPPNGLESRGLKRPAESEERGAAAAAAPSGIPSKVGVRIITISDPNNAGSSATMVAVPAGTDPSTVAKVAIENAAQQRNCSPTGGAVSTVRGV